MSVEDVGSESVDQPRRRFLTQTTTVVGAAGTVALAIPFFTSMSPSARAKAAGAPVEADISKLEPGQMVTYEWRGKPVWIVRRTPDLIEALTSLETKLADPASDNSNQQPEYARNQTRSRKPEVLVMEGVCTHLGCSPKFRPELTATEFDAEWRGGFFCPCHGSKFDIAGRVYTGVPAPINLKVPRHMYLSDDTIIIGVDEEGAA